MSALKIVDINLDDQIKIFLDNQLNKLTTREYKSAFESFRAYLNTELNQAMNLDNVNFSSAISYRNYLTSRGLAPATVNKKFSPLRNFFKTLKNAGIVTLNPFAGVNLPKVSRQQKAPVIETQDVNKLLSAANKNDLGQHGYGLALKLMFHLGLRSAEVASIQLANIFKEGSVWLIDIHGKGDKYRTLPLSDELRDDINKYHSHFEATTSFKLTENDFIIQTSYKLKKAKNTSPANTSQLRRAFKRFAEKAGVDSSIRTHSARATLITKLINENIPMAHIKEFVGHSSIQTTDRYYRSKQKNINSVALSIKY